MPKAGIQFSKKDEWWTPKEVVDHFGTFDYDPATTKELAEKFGIPNYDTILTDGLKTDWTQYEKIWCNPPFTRKFEFLEKAVASGANVYILLPIETLTTKAFHDIMKGTYYNLHIPNGRIKFEDGSGASSSPAFGSCVIELNAKESRIFHWKIDKSKKEVI